MALTIDQATKRITIPQADLTFISGTLYELDTETFRTEMNSLMDDEDHIWMDDYAVRNAPVTVAGTTFAQTIEITNGWSIEFENLSYAVRLASSNNNLFDVDGGILITSPLVNVIAQNSAGLISSPEITVIRKLIQNKQIVNNTSDKMEIYGDDGTTIEYEGDIWNDDGVTPWDGTSPIIRRDRLDEV